MMPFDLFISYPHQNLPIAEAGLAQLEAEGLCCWMAPRTRQDSSINRRGDA
jgi:hypothetical protein